MASKNILALATLCQADKSAVSLLPTNQVRPRVSKQTSIIQLLASTTLTGDSSMVLNPLPSRIDLLRATLQKVEQDSDLRPDDPAFVELKRILLQRIADLELADLDLASSPADGEAAKIGAAESPLDPALAPVIDTADVTPLLPNTDDQPPQDTDATPLDQSN